jgi:hypothetical protein
VLLDVFQQGKLRGLENYMCVDSKVSCFEWEAPFDQYIMIETVDPQNTILRAGGLPDARTRCHFAFHAQDCSGRAWACAIPLWPSGHMRAGTHRKVLSLVL